MGNTPEVIRKYVVEQFPGAQPDQWPAIELVKIELLREMLDCVAIISGDLVKLAAAVEKLNARLRQAAKDQERAEKRKGKQASADIGDLLFDDKREDRFCSKQNRQLGQKAEQK